MFSGGLRTMVFCAVVQSYQRHDLPLVCLTTRFRYSTVTKMISPRFRSKLPIYSRSRCECAERFREQFDNKEGWQL